jgi:hypothetical protein
MLDLGRSLGLPCRGRYAGGGIVTWTTREDVATAMREAGASTTFYKGSTPQFSGWEVAFPADAAPLIQADYDKGEAA